MNNLNKKKIAMFAIPFLMVALVSALAYYGIFSVTLDVTQPVSIVGDELQSVSCIAGGTCTGTILTVSNSAEDERSIVVSEVTDEEISTSYTSTLTLSQKVVDFESEGPWALTGETATVEYTIVGDSFSAEIIDGSKTGYVLVYYKDNSDRFANPANAIAVDEVTENLPYETDGNADEYDYCSTGEYDTCHGAKIWYIPETAVTDGVIDWTQASNFLFETSLIQYNAEGELVVYSGSSVGLVPQFYVETHAETDEYNAVITIA